jgi:hypothetical protein
MREIERVRRGGRPRPKINPRHTESKALVKTTDVHRIHGAEKKTVISLTYYFRTCSGYLYLKILYYR